MLKQNVLILNMRIAVQFWSFLWKVYVATIFVIFALLLYPPLFVLLSRPTWKIKSFKIFVFWSWMMRIFCFYPVQKLSEGTLPAGPYVIISNHSSYLDIFLMHSIMSKHPFLFMGKSEILSYPIIKTYFKGLNIPVDRKDRTKAARSFNDAKKAVQEGWSIMIFPEGTIPDDQNPKMLPFKNGAFKLAKALNIPIVPITFVNNFQLFSEPLDLKGTAHPGTSRIYIHPAIHTTAIEKLSDKELSALCYRIINEPLAKAYPELCGDKSTTSQTS
jgi:1-acyl-sn-glycerol-3-phosphate acyltransferase